MPKALLESKNRGAKHLNYGKNKKKKRKRTGQECFTKSPYESDSPLKGDRKEDKTRGHADTDTTRY